VPVSPSAAETAACLIEVDERTNVAAAGPEDRAIPVQVLLRQPPVNLSSSHTNDIPEVEALRRLILALAYIQQYSPCLSI